MAAADCAPPYPWEVKGTPFKSNEILLDAARSYINTHIEKEFKDPFRDEKIRFFLARGIDFWGLCEQESLRFDKQIEHITKQSNRVKDLMSHKDLLSRKD